MRALGAVDGIVVPGGFGIRGIRGKLGALRFAREQGIPTLGICLGLQCMVIEYARNVAFGIADASSSEFDPDTAHPVIATMAEQVDIIDHGARPMGGTMRLGLYEAELAEGSLAAEVYGATRASERHRHRYEVARRCRDQMREGGSRSRGCRPTTASSSTSSCRATCTRITSPHRAHPELRSRPTQANPLFRGLIAAALERHRASELFKDEVERV